MDSLIPAAPGWYVREVDGHGEFLDPVIARAAREAEAARQREADAKVMQELRTHQAKTDTDRALERIARLVKKHSSTVGGITLGELNRRLRSSDRPLLQRAVDVAEAHEWVFLEGDRVCVHTG